MKKLIFILIFLATLKYALALDHVIISEVYYDPINNEIGGEAVELYNPTETTIDISSWAIATKSSAHDALIPSNRVIKPKSYFLVADSDWSSAKDNSSWNNADYEEAMTLANTDGSIMLVDRNNITLDAVGWGSAANLDSNMYEGTPANRTKEGFSLQRRMVNDEFQDTGNNELDFISGIPNLENSSSYVSYINTDLEVSLVVNENEAPLHIDFIDIEDDDSTLEGVQIIPFPKENRSAKISVQLSNVNGLSNVNLKASLDYLKTDLVLSEPINSTTAVYEGYMKIPFYFSAGNYNLVILNNANPAANESVEIQPVIAIELDTASLNLEANGNGIVESLGDRDFSTKNNPTIKNIGNKATDIEVYGTSLQNGNSEINVNNIKYSFDGSNYDGSLGGILSEARARKIVNLLPGFSSLREFSVKISVPPESAAGNYQGTISLVAVAST